ncbi:hypothetical protein GC170_22025 [bacterium]|nr:hypothetical protein [bacterium]
MTIESEAKKTARFWDNGRLGRAIFRQSLAIAFGVAVVLTNHPQEWVTWQKVLVFLLAWDLMMGAIGLITPEVRSWAERFIWRRSRGLSAFWCATHVHPWIVPLAFPALHDFRFAFGLHGGCVISALVLHRMPGRYRGPLAMLAAGMTGIVATQRGVPAGFGWMAFIYPAKCVLCWWLPCGRLEVEPSSMESTT